MLHQITKFRLNLAFRGRVNDVVGYAISRWHLRWRSTTSSFVFNVVTLFRSSESIYKPNFIDICQFTADIWLLPVWTKQTSAILEFFSSYNFGCIIVIGVLFRIRLSNFVQSGHPLQSNDIIYNFMMAAVLAQYYFRFRIWWCHSLPKVKSICKPNFVDIS